jgi:DNA-binding transcriptional ArsR family regulator
MLATLARASAEVCVCDFTDALPLNQPTVSHHLRILREAGLVTCERRGTWVYYELAPDALARVNAAVGNVFEQKVLA